MSYLSERRGVSPAGRRVLAAAVLIDHDWGLRSSSEDKLIAAVEQLPDDDLDGAYLLAHYLKEAVACVRMDRQMAEVAARAGPIDDGTTSTVDGHEDTDSV